MFKTAATKLAHNSTLPSLGGNNDLRPLQDLIISEKAVLMSMQKLSMDLGKAAEALRTWGIGEGDDLGDTLSASTTILSSFSHALSQYATHEHAIRDHMKSIRSREEMLDELKRRRKAVVAKADTAEKKLSKMSPEHKNMAMQTDLLNRLRDEIRAMDSDIMTEEAGLGDFKRSTTRSMLGLKFGGLLEFSEKGTIIGEYGKLIVGEIPDDVTQPGMPRRLYNNHHRVESLVSEAYKCVNEVGFSTVPSQPAERRFAAPSQSPVGSPTRSEQQRESGGYLGMVHLIEPSDVSQSPSTPVSPIYSQQFSSPPILSNVPSESNRAVDDFGLMQRSSNNPEPYAGRFATFPVNNQQRGFQLQDGPPSLSAGRSEGPEDDFASSIASALRLPANEKHAINEEPAPSYDSHQYAPPPGPPPGAALAVDSKEARRASAAVSEDIGLAYDEEPPYGHHSSDSSSRNMVRFGSVRDIDAEMERRRSEDQEGQPARVQSPVQQQSILGQASMTQPEPVSLQDEAAHEPRGHLPSPVMSAEDEEKALNAAAAREVSRELDALSFSPPAPLNVTPRLRSQSPPMTTPIVPSSPSVPPRSPTMPVNREPSPLIPPSAPFHNAAPTAAQSYAQSHRRSGSFSYDGAVPASPLSESRGLSSSPTESRPQPPQISLAYPTPQEFSAPRPAFSNAPLRSASSTSVNSIGTVPPGTRTISAAAFRRPPPRMASSGSGDFGGPADTSPLTFKKRLPSSPYPPAGAARLAPSSSLSEDTTRSVSASPSVRQSVAPDDEDDFDYIGAYSHASENGSPLPSHFPSNLSSRASGYGQGRFATDLEADGLR